MTAGPVKLMILQDLTIESLPMLQICYRVFGPVNANFLQDLPVFLKEMSCKLLSFAESVSPSLKADCDMPPQETRTTLIRLFLKIST